MDVCADATKSIICITVPVTAFRFNSWTPFAVNMQLTCISSYRVFNIEFYSVAQKKSFACTHTNIDIEVQIAIANHHSFAMENATKIVM